MRLRLIFPLLLLLAATACTPASPSDAAEPQAGSANAKPGPTLAVEDSLTIRGGKHFVKDFPATYPNGDIAVVVEIPTGTRAKWEVDKSTGYLIWTIQDGAPRQVNYLGYPGNYGMVPRTLLPTDLGGDGDPLDVIMPGEALPRGSVVRARLLGVLKLIDRGETDDKLIAVTPDGPFGHINSLAELQAEFSGLTDILETWFANYKGPDKMKSLGLGDETEAQAILDAAIKAYQP